MSQSTHPLQSQIQSMSSDRVKSIVLFWLETKEKTIVEFEQLVENSDEDGLSELDDFQPTQLLSDGEMISESLAIFADYRQNPKGITHDAVKTWSDRLGRDDELPCPQ